VTDLNETIKARIAELEVERERTVTLANQQLAALSGAIRELETLLKIEETSKEQDIGGQDG